MTLIDLLSRVVLVLGIMGLLYAGMFVYVWIEAAIRDKREDWTDEGNARPKR